MQARERRLQQGLEETQQSPNVRRPEPPGTSDDGHDRPPILGITARGPKSGANRHDADWPLTEGNPCRSLVANA